MSNKKNISRRDFLKLGVLSSVVLPVAKIIQSDGKTEVVSSPDEYGDFYIRRHTKDDPPYDVDNTIYERPNSSKAMNPILLMGMPVTTLTRLTTKDPGFSRLDIALDQAAWTLAVKNHTMDDLSGGSGLYSWQPLEGTSPEHVDTDALPRWNPADDGLSPQEVTRRVKKAAKFLGASLSGVAELDERWFYSKQLNVSIEDFEALISDAPKPDLPDVNESGLSAKDALVRALMSMDKDDHKTLILEIIESADPAILPADLGPAQMKIIPASMLQKDLPNVITLMSPELLELISQQVDPSLLPDDFDPQKLYEEFDPSAAMSLTDLAPTAEIIFDDVEEPAILEDGTRIIPKSMNRIIVMGFEMDMDAVNTENSKISTAAISNGYSRMAVTAASVAEFIRYLGYHAIPLGNDTALSVPIAVDAGLGELSRIGIVVTPKYGPRVRWAKVLTDLPLVPDGPITFGVTEFCEVCGKCADECPGGAIKKGKRSYDAPHSGNPGVLKWAVEGFKCQQVWSDIGTDCFNCIRCCPFTKPEGWLHEITRILIGVQSGSIDKLLVKLDDASGYGKPDDAESFWDKDNYIHVNS